MKHRYVVFLSFMVVIMFAMMSFSQINFSGNNGYNSINPDTVGQSYIWCLDGTTSIHVNSNSEVILTIDVTSYKANSPKPTEMCFVVSNNTESCYLGYERVSSTGIYTYNWHYTLYGEVHLSARYLCVCSQLMPYTIHSTSGVIPSINPPPGGYYRQYFTEFGDSSAYFNKPLTLPATVLDYIGYDGNNTIYLSNVVSSVIHQFNLSKSYANNTKCYNENGFKTSMANSIGLSAHISQGYNTESKSECIYVTMFAGASGYAGSKLTYTRIMNRICGDIEYNLRPYYTSLSISGINASPSTEMCYKQFNSTGINTTTTYSSDKPGFNMTIYKQKIFEGILNSTLKYMGIQSSLCSIAKYYSDSSLDSHNLSAQGSGVLDIHFEVDKNTGKSIGKNKCYYTYGTIVTYAISISNYTNAESFKLGFNNVYGCTVSTDGHSGTSSLISGASTSLNVNTATSSAIYGTVGKTPGCIVHINGKSYSYDLSLNSSIYIENANTHTFYNATIKDGNFLFFAQPNTEYRMYYLNNGQLKEFYQTPSIETGSPGTSMPESLYE